MRKALCVGIDSYKAFNDLRGCVNDANAVKNVLERNGDGILNFDVKIMCATSEVTYITKGQLKDSVEELFKSDVEIALFYFAGHGSLDTCGGYLCTSENSRVDDGFSLNDLMKYVADSPAKNKVIVLDSCHSGSIARMDSMQNYSALSSGTTILAACGPCEVSEECNGHGVFTDLFVEALYGGSMTLLGDVTPGSIYAYIDRSLGAWKQRPVFKANINRFVSLRKCIPPITIHELRRLTEFFDTPSYAYPLDPSFEHDKHEVEDKSTNKEHEDIFALLQKYVRLNLVVPVGEDHMYYAAIHSKSCKLTVQGQHYWHLIKNKTI